MQRIPPVDADCQEPAALTAAIRVRRGGRLLNLDRALLRSAPLATAWNAYLGAIRGALALSPLLRELAICGVAVLNGADYEFAQHEPEFRRAGGSETAAGLLGDFDAAARDAVHFDPMQRAVMRLTISMTRQVKVSDEVWTAIEETLPDVQARVEIVAVIATYNMVSRFLVACRIEPE